MNQNCTCGTNYNIHPKFTVYHTGIVFDERAGFVESVCATLIESRYGPGRASQLVVKLSDRPETESAVFFELSDGEMVPSYALSPIGRCGYQVIEAGYRRAKQMGLFGCQTERPQSRLITTPPRTRLAVIPGTRTLSLRDDKIFKIWKRAV